MCRKNCKERKATIESRQRLLVALDKAAEKMTDSQPVFREIAKQVRGNANNHYLGFSTQDLNMVAYSKNGKADKHVPSRRIRTKLGRYLHREYVDQLAEVAECVIEEFVNLVLSHRPVGERITMLMGRDIVQAYADGLGWRSCMTGDGAQYTEVYAANPAKCQMLVYRGPGDFVARAMVFTCDDGTIALDRTYPNSGTHVEVIRQYAWSQGWLVRSHQSLPSGDTGFIDSEGDSVGNLSLTLDRTDDGYWPYMDSFRFCDGNKSRVTFFTAEEGGMIIANSQSGYLGPGVFCRACDESIADDNSRNGYCEECYGELYTWSEAEDCDILISDSCEYDGDNVASIEWVANNCCRCRLCEAMFSATTTIDSQKYCEACVDDYFLWCNECDEYVRNGAYNNDQDCCVDCVETETEIEVTNEN